MTVAAREPQQERSRQTRERLLAVTVDMLAHSGWSATTVTAVAEAAGVSRGAAQHHFPAREDLITAVLEEMFTEMTAEAAQTLDNLPDGPERIDLVVDRAVAIYTGVPFKAALQVWAAAASDEALRELILPLEAKLARAAHKLTVQGLDPDGRHGAQAHRLAQLTLDLARGLGLADTLSDDSARRAQVTAAWVQQLQSTLHT
ncbi:putative TetR family transcriptional regulator [Gordonia hirsuta DSM 44140 = NBRC 16056]|uniref:Putative TetR family transcriptional regulator n=1 Tax=Gordonia hirsuta DSM 44140 = NBRC 16056 TaxID=1121927 RepID=L7L6H3_9ACTN|nr:TetR/AcrR family transcriptional regulator [Gordonia hirsuta]GAC56514.1 putative TetR family transcriptional regulator [Gordonia hirsuta DSM 44140 = NBRC 16056]